MARILVADDEEGCRDFLEAVLAEEHEVKAARDGPSALELTRTWAPDVAVLDVNLVGLSGVDLARQLQGRVQSVAFTGAPDLPVDQLTLFAAVLPKPACPDAIRKAIRHALATRPAS